MHSSAFGAAERMVFRSFSSAARLSSLKAARYSSMVLGPPAMACPPGEVAGITSILPLPTRRTGDTEIDTLSASPCTAGAHCEEPALRARFGADYAAYGAAVRRWW